MKKILYLWLSLIAIISSVFSITAAQNGTPSDDTSTVSSSTTTTTTTNLTAQDNGVGISLSDGCLTGVWKNCFDYEKLIWIKTKYKYTATSIAKDIIYAATYAVWAVLTIVIIWCGLGYIFAAKDWTDPKAYKDWLIKAAIWAVLVRWAYAIVRLIQYIAKW